MAILLSTLRRYWRQESPPPLKYAACWISLPAENATGFVIPNEFVLGYGLDFNNFYRNLPYVGVLKPEYYE